MRLTPLDIRKQEFSRELRGYEADEVDAFLQMVSEQWEELLDDVRRKSEEIRDLEAKLAHYEKVEEALQEALQTARETSKKSIENAEQKASLMIQRAEARAEEITRDAERERHQVKRETAKLSSRRSEIVTRLRAFLMSEMELLASYEGDDPVGFIKLLPADKKRLRQLSERLDEEADESAFEHDARAEEPRTTQASSSAQPADAASAGTDETSEAAPYDEEDAGRKPSQVESAADDEDDIPADVTAADHAEQKRYWYDSFEPNETSRTESHDEQHSEEGDEVSDGPGWTTRTFVSNAADERRPARPDDGDRDEQANADDETTTRASSEEIEKIRRILSDLD